MTLFKENPTDDVVEVTKSLSDLTATQTEILSILAEDPFMPALQIAERIGKSRTTVFRVLSELSERGYIKKEGRGSERKYIVRSF